MAKTPKTILEDAKTILTTRGWTQDQFHKGGKFCALGAVDAASYGITFVTRSAETEASRSVEVTKANSAARRALTYAVHDLDPDNYSIVAYNDAPGRTAEEVLKVFDLAIASAE